MKSDHRKTIIMLFLCAILLFSSVTCQASEDNTDQIPSTTSSLSYSPGVYEAKAKGYGGYIFATITVGENGTITDVKLVGESETPDVGGYALSEYPSTIIEEQSADLDTITGATLTSKAVLEATQLALADAQKAVGMPVYKPGTYSGSAKGYGGYVTADVVIGADGKIEKVVLKGDKETPDIGGYALEDIADWMLKAQSADVDTYSGATFTSNGAIDAVKAALELAQANSTDQSYKPGVYHARAKGYGGYVSVTISIDSSGKIAQVDFEGDHETPDVGGLALETFPAIIIETQSGDLDAVSGATLTSKAAVEAVNIALAEAKK